MTGMETIVRANEESLRDLKIASHRTRAVSANSTTPPSSNRSSQTDLEVVRLEEFVVNKQPMKKGWILPLFIVMGVGLNMPYAALNGAIVYFSEMFGPSYYLDFLAAFNIPAIPLLTAQLLWDEKMDNKYGSRITFSFRLIATFSIMAVCTFLIPLMVHSFLYVIVLISIIGIANGIAFGSMFQLGAIFSSKGTACIFVGLGLGNLFTTITLFLLRFDANADNNMSIVPTFFQIHAGMVVLSVVAIIIVMLTKPIGSVLEEKDRVARQKDNPDYEPLLSVNPDEEASVLPKKRSRKKSNGTWRTNLLVLRKTWKSQVAMFLTYFTGVIILSFIAYLPQVGEWKSDGLFVLLALYINVYGDFAGKNLTLLPTPIKSDVTLLVLSVLRALYVIYFFLYITLPDLPRNDYLILGTMGIVATLGGYLTNLMFTIAPTTAPEEYKQQVASMVTLVLHIAVYSAIGISFLLTAYIKFYVP